MLKGLKPLAAIVFICGFWTSCSKYDPKLQTQDYGEIDQFLVSDIEGQYIVELEKLEEFKLNKVEPRYSDKIALLQSRIIEHFAEINLTDDQILFVYGASVTGFAAQLDNAQLAFLRNSPSVKNVEQDQMLILKKPDNPGGGKGGKDDDDSDPAEVTPYGITRVGGSGDGTGKRAWIIDSGVDLDHNDLNVDVNNSISYLTGSKSNQSPEDQHGHGTHVAGTVGAIDNEIGVVGVAANATIVAVRVLDRRGSGSTSGVIKGVDHVAANASSGDVANMSLGGGVSTTLDNAVIAAATGGTKFVLAAGNDGDDANYHSPARANHSNIYTISAMDANDVFASFSNYGNPPVDYCAPGVSVTSTWKSNGYRTISGTSMAAPHVTGILLLGAIQMDGTVSNDPDNVDDPIAHR